MAFTAFDFRTEYRSDPLGIGVPDPRFSWKTAGGEQTAYHITVTDGDAPVWDTGRVESTARFGIVYGGKPLVPRTAYHVTVTVFCGSVSATVGGVFETGFFSLSDWPAAFVTAKTDKPAPLYAKGVFTLSKPPKTARLYVASTTGAFGNLTFCINDAVFYLNGKRVGNDAVFPGQNSEKRGRALYRAYDVTGDVLPGDNVFSAVLVSMGFSACAEVSYTDGTREVFPLGRELVTRADGPYRLFDDGVEDQGGKREDYDATREIPDFFTADTDPARWTPARVTNFVRALSPQTVLTETQKILPAVSVTKVGFIHYIADFGENLHGHIRLTLRNPARGHRVSVRYAEILGENGDLDYGSTVNYPRGENGPHTDTYIPRGDAVEVFEPVFANHGFRYADIIGTPDEPAPADVQTCLVSSAPDGTAGFACGNETINALYAISRRAQRNNLVSVPTDCPHRERHGWLGDALAVCRSECQNFDLLHLMENYARLMADDQRADGFVQYISPFQNPVTQPDVPWNAAAAIIPWEVYRATGDRRILEHSFPTIVGWLGYLDSMCDGEGLLRGGVLWNDHTAKTRMDGTWLGTLYYYRTLTMAADIAQVLGRAEEAAYRERAAAVRTALQSHYRTDSGYAAGEQNDLAHALYFGIADEGEREAITVRLTEKLAADGRITCGVLGLYALIPALSDNGRDDTVYAIANDTREGTFGGWIAHHGATTACEFLDYDPWFSLDHPFLMGSITAWFVERLVGIRPTAAGYAAFAVDPYQPEDLPFAEATVSTLYGDIFARWERQGVKLRYTLRVPSGTHCTLHLPRRPAALPANAQTVPDGLRLGEGEYEIVV